jgi:hypothetical protein
VPEANATRCAQVLDDDVLRRCDIADLDPRPG